MVYKRIKTSILLNHQLYRPSAAGVCVCERLLSVGTVSMPMHRSLDMQAHVLSLLVMRMMKSHWIGYPLLLRSKTLKNKAGGN